MTILSSGIETPDYGASGWNHVYNRDIDLLNFELLKLQALQDVDVSSLEHGDVLVYNSSTQKWEIYVP